MFKRNIDSPDKAVERILDPRKRASLISSLEKKLPLQKFSMITGIIAFLISMLLDLVDKQMEHRLLPLLFGMLILCMMNYRSTVQRLIQAKLEDARQNANQ